MNLVDTFIKFFFEDLPQIPPFGTAEIATKHVQVQ